jgi:signal transduction histidine kinase
MSKLVKLMVGACLGVVVSTSAFASGEKGTPEEAVKMVKSAVEHINQVGKEKALADFSDKGNKDYHQKDLYVYVVDMKGIFLSHPNPRMMNRNLIEMVDANGKAFVKDIIDVANKKGSGWIDYRWSNPSTGNIDPKSTYIEKTGDTIIATGIYK